MRHWGAIGPDSSGEYEGKKLKEDEIELKLVHLLLKLESIHNVTSKCIIDFAADLQFISSSVSGPGIRETVNSCLKKHDCELEEMVVSDSVKELSESNPISKALRPDGCLATAYKREKFYKKTFNVVEPVEYILDQSKGLTFQYVPILKSLSQILSQKDVLEKAFTLYTTDEGSHFMMTHIIKKMHFFPVKKCLFPS